MSTKPCQSRRHWLTTHGEHAVHCENAGPANSACKSRGVGAVSHGLTAGGVSPEPRPELGPAVASLELTRECVDGRGSVRAASHLTPLRPLSALAGAGKGLRSSEKKPCVHPWTTSPACVWKEAHLLEADEEATDLVRHHPQRGLRRSAVVALHRRRRRRALCGRKQNKPKRH